MLVEDAIRGITRTKIINDLVIDTNDILIIIKMVILLVIRIIDHQLTCVT